jgi:hypothetical protein
MLTSSTVHAADGDGGQLIVISAAFDSGSMASASVSGDVVTLRPRTYPFNGNTTSWWNSFRIDGAAGRTLSFVYDTTGLNLHGHESATRYVISYDQQTWQFPDSTSGSGSGYSFTHTFTQDTAWVAYGIPYPVSRVDATVANWASSPWVSPTPSSNADLKILDTGSGTPWLTPGGVNELGFAIPSHPLYAFCITDDRAAGSKANLVIMAGNHAGEPNGNHTLEGLVDWLLGDAPRAVALRRAARIFVYPMSDPDGRYGGYSRSNQLLPDGDHNREWDVASNGTLPEIDRLQEAMRLDCEANATFFLDIHNQEKPDQHYMFLNNGWQNTPFVEGMLTYFSPFSLSISPNFDTRIARGWARASTDGLNAANSFTMEPGSWPVTTPAIYHEFGQTMGWSLFDALVGESAYYLWAADEGLSGDDALPGADPDWDGLMNRWEQGLESDPQVREVAYSPSYEKADGVFRVSYVQPAGGTGTPGQDYSANGIRIQLQSRAELHEGSWQTVTDPLDIRTTPIDAQRERVEIDCSADTPAGFFRLLVLPSDP